MRQRRLFGKGRHRLKACLLRCRKLSAIGRHKPCNPSNLNGLARRLERLARAWTNDWERKRDESRQLRISRRTVTIAVALVGLVSLAIGAHAALNKRSLDAAKAIATEQTGSIGRTASRVALVIGNGHYPDASAPLAQPINDARGLTAALRGKGFDVDVVEDATKDDMARAIVPAEGQDQAGHRGDAVLRRLWRPGRPRKLHDPGRRRDLEGSRRPPRRRLDRTGAGRDDREGRQGQARRRRRLPPQPL